jgi:phenylalanine-4-hydroxylase
VAIPLADQPGSPAFSAPSPVASAFVIELDADHPGFRDSAYRTRRDVIARIALQHRRGTPVPRAPYSPEEEELWRVIWAKLAPLHVRHACREMRAAQDVLGLARGGIPQLGELNERLEPLSGFRMEPVAGLVAARSFFNELAGGVFLSTQYIRHASRPFYTPEPDVVHETVGHAASFPDRAIAELTRAFGYASLHATEAEIQRLARVYWWTLEFGLVEEDGRTLVVGAGLLSSAEEITLAHRPRLVPFDPDAMAATPYDPTRLQDLAFVAPSFRALRSELLAWLERGAWRGWETADEGAHRGRATEL